jgi:hypothetical protein
MTPIVSRSYRGTKGIGLFLCAVGFAGVVGAMIAFPMRSAIIIYNDGDATPASNIKILEEGWTTNKAVVTPAMPYRHSQSKKGNKNGN